MAPKRKRASDALGVRGLDAVGLDQYFTKPEVASACVSSLESVVPLLDFDLILEPSFGDGAFVGALREKNIEPPTLVFVDVDASDESYREDFLSEFAPSPCFRHPLPDSVAVPRAKFALTIGNPPFGKNSSLAISFFNRAAEFSDVIAFLVPRTFCKISVQDRLDRHFFLARQDDIPADGFTFEGESYDVPCVFQVWAHAGFMDNIQDPPPMPKGGLRASVPRKVDTADFRFVTPSQGPDLAIRRVGVNAGRMFVEEIQTRSEQSHFFLRVFDRSCVSTVLTTIRSLDLERTPSKFQTAGCPSISKHELCTLYTTTIAHARGHLHGNS